MKEKEDAAKKLYDANKKKYDDAQKADSNYKDTDAGKALAKLYGENKTAWEADEKARKEQDTKLAGAKTKRDTDLKDWQTKEDKRVKEEVEAL